MDTGRGLRGAWRRRARSALLAVPLLASFGAGAEAAGDVVRIGVLNDRSGPYSDITGQGSVVAAQLAVDEFGGTVMGKKIEIISADHQNKPDIGASIARRWYDADGVDVIVDVVTSSVALAVQQIAKDKNRIAIFSGAGSDELTGAACTKNTFVWSWDAYALTHAVGRSLASEGRSTWFLVEVDYALGRALERGVRSVLAETNGRVVGIARHSLGTSDFASFLLQAQASGASVIGMLNGGADAVNAIKQAGEFGIARDGTQRLAAIGIMINDIKALGVKDGEGLLVSESFYWDLNPEARAWAGKFAARMEGRMPSMIQAGTYSAVRHYLRSIEKAGTVEADGVTTAMGAIPVDDPTVSPAGARIRADGRLLRDFHVFRVKAAAQSQSPWDLYAYVATVPAAEVAIPEASSACPLVRNRN
jgi:branched-chain amino acid transport system substrate-binding protein